MPNANDLIAFYADAGRDGRGRTRSEAGGTWTVAPSEDFEQRKRVWVTPYNHNYLRQTRILKSLTLLGLEPLARAWLECLSMVYRANADVVGHETFEYWRAAVR